MKLVLMGSYESEVFEIPFKYPDSLVPSGFWNLTDQEEAFLVTYCHGLLYNDSWCPGEDYGLYLITSDGERLNLES